MSTRIIVVVSVFCGALLGAFLYAVCTARPKLSRDESERSADGADALAIRFAELEKEHEELRTAHEDLREEQHKSAEIIARLRQNPLDPTGAGEATAAGAAPTPIAGADLAVTFGPWGDEPALRTADWQEMAQDASDIFRARCSGIGGRQPKAMGALERKSLRTLREQLGRIDAESATPQLSRHPVVFLNMMASHLQQAGEPFDTRQLARIDTEGNRHESAVAQLEGEVAAAPEFLPTERKLRLIQLKRRLVDTVVNEVLTLAQWAILFDPNIKGLLYYDVYQVGGLELERPNSAVYWRGERAGARQHLEVFLTTEWAIPEEEMPRLGTLVDEWIDAIASLPRVPGHPTSALHIDEVMPCAETHVEFQKRALALFTGDADVRQGIFANPVYAVFPRFRE